MLTLKEQFRWKKLKLNSSDLLVYSVLEKSGTGKKIEFHPKQFQKKCKSYSVKPLSVTHINRIINKLEEVGLIVVLRKFSGWFQLIVNDRQLVLFPKSKNPTKMSSDLKSENSSSEKDTSKKTTLSSNEQQQHITNISCITRKHGFNYVGEGLKAIANHSIEDILAAQRKI